MIGSAQVATSEIIAGDRLDLVPFHDRLLKQRYVGWLNDPETVRYSEQRHQVHTLESCRIYAESFHGTPHYFWGIMAREADFGHVGNITATVSLRNRTADLAILVGEASARGRGLGLEAWRCALAYLLGPGGLRKVTAGAMALNRPMLRVMEASGMVDDGRKARQFLLDGEEVDAVYVARFAAGA